MANAPAAPKYQQIADQIETDVRSGKWAGGRMPSVREIASRYATSTVTASRAIQVVRDKGLIQSVERSGTFCLPGASAEKYALLFRVTSGPHSHEVLSSTRLGFEQLARRDRFHLLTDVFRLRPDLTLDQATEAARSAIAEGIHGLFFLPSRSCAAETAVETLFLQGCRKAELPVIFLERNLRSHTTIDHDMITLDDTQAAVDCTTHLISLGCKRIGLAVASPTTTHQDRVAGYLRALYTHRRRSTDYPDHVIWLQDETQTPQLGPLLFQEVKTRDLDGIICYHDYVAIALMMECYQNHKRIPQQLAIVGFENLNVASFSSMGLTSYDYPSLRFAEEAVRRMRERVKHPSLPAIKIVVPGQLFVRGSTNPDANVEHTVMR